MARQSQPAIATHNTVQPSATIEGSNMTINGVTAISDHSMAVCGVAGINTYCAVTSTKPKDWFAAPAQVAAFDYVGRVSTFYSGASATYSETYEPARQSAFGLIFRVESRIVNGFWRHLAYDAKGKAVANIDDNFLLFDQSNLPLMFDPELELSFARKMLTAASKRDMVILPREVIVYTNQNQTSLGLIRRRVGL
jgi:hypothetical protein